MENVCKSRMDVPFDLGLANFRLEDLAIDEFVDEVLFEELVQESEECLQAVSETWKAYHDRKNGCSCCAIMMCVLCPCCAISKAMVRSDDLASLDSSFHSAWLQSERRCNARLQERLFERGYANRLKAVLIMEKKGERPSPQSSRIFLRLDKIPSVACSS